MPSRAKRARLDRPRCGDPTGFLRSLSNHIRKAHGETLVATNRRAAGDIMPKACLQHGDARRRASTPQFRARISGGVGRHPPYACSDTSRPRRHSTKVVTACEVWKRVTDDIQILISYMQHSAKCISEQPAQLIMGERDTICRSRKSQRRKLS